jgi:hypothetical protein
MEIFHRAPLEPDQEWLDYLETLAEQAAIAIDNSSLFADLQRSNLDLTLAYDATIEGWSHALDLRDKETEGHTRRVTEMTLRLARAMGMSENELVHVRRGALLHDIGKLGVPDQILLKPGKLSEEEWVWMRKHPVYAYEMLAPIAYLKPAGPGYSLLPSRKMGWQRLSVRVKRGANPSGCPRVCHYRCLGCVNFGQALSTGLVSRESPGIYSPGIRPAF